MSLNSQLGRMGFSVPRSATKLVAVAAVALAAVVVLHRVTAPRPSLQELSRHGNDMVGKTVQVYWPSKREWYKARITKYNVAGTNVGKKGLEGTHTLVYEDDSVVNSYLHKLKYHVVYGRELVGHLISIYRPSLGFYKVANVTAFDAEDELHTLQFEDGGLLKLALSLEDFQLIFGRELEGKVIEIRRELRDEPIYASVLHYSEYKGTFVLAFADGTLQDLDLKGVSFEIVHNPASAHSSAITATNGYSHASSSLRGLVPEIEAGADESRPRNYDAAVAEAAFGQAGGGGEGAGAAHRFHSAAEYKEDPLRGALLQFVEVEATPGQIAILTQARRKFEQGLQAHVKKHLDEPNKWFPCASEHNDCQAIDYCADRGRLLVRFGHIDFKWIEKTIERNKFPVNCNADVFGSDPVVGRGKYCEIKCDREEDEVKNVDSCSVNSLPFIHELAHVPLCAEGAEKSAPKDEAEAALQAAVGPFCESKELRHVTDLHLDCRYQGAYKTFAAAKGWAGTPRSTDWIDRAFVAFFAGPPTGAHAGMVTNLIRSVHMFSKYPIIVYAVNTTNLAEEWDPEAFPRLIVVHTNGFSGQLRETLHVSFNFHKFRSMMLRVRTGIQLDADMLVAKNIDRLFDATHKHVTSDYPYPILPVHWMSRMKGADGYSDSYFVPYDKFRIRWAHAHPTWTYNALVFVAQALMAKLSVPRWKTWVQRDVGAAPDDIPQNFVFEDEDMLNVLLWRHNATKQWCKWDVEPSVFEDFLTQNTNQPGYPDSVWYKNGIPLMMIGMHNTKDPIATDKLLGRLRREPVSNNYVYHQGTYFANPFDVEKLEHVHCLAA